MWNGPAQDNFDIYVKVVGAEPPLRLTTDPAADYSPAWSPDGRAIAFLRDLSGGRLAVMLVAPIGGPERKVAEVSSRFAALGAPAWAPDAKSLAIPDRDAQGADGIALVSIDTGDKRRLTSPPVASSHDYAPAFSPDGRTLAFVRAKQRGADVLALPLSTGLTPEGAGEAAHVPQLPVLRPYLDPRRPTGHRRSGNRHEVRQSVESCRRWFRTPGADAVCRRRGGQSERVATGRSPRVCQRCRRRPEYLATRPDCAGSAAFADKRSVRRLATTPARSSHRTASESPSIRTDRAMRRSGCAAATAPARCRLRRSAARDAARHAGRLAEIEIVFEANPEGNWDIFAVPASGGAARRLTTQSSQEAIPSWSHDGTWIYFWSDRTGTPQIWKMPNGGGAAVQVTRQGGFAALESPDGRFLYYTKTDDGGDGLWRMPVSGGAETRIIHDAIATRAFFVTADSIYFIKAVGEQWPLFRQPHGLRYDRDLQSPHRTDTNARQDRQSVAVLECRSRWRFAPLFSDAAGRQRAPARRALPVSRTRWRTR